MMRNIKTKLVASLAIVAMPAWLFGQRANEEMRAFIKDGLVKWQSDRGDLNFRVGGRAMIDGAYFFDDYTDRGSGVVLNEARLRVYSSFAKDFDAKFDVDFARNKVRIKDMYVRWHAGKNYFVKLGNYNQPFSIGSIESNFDTKLLARPATVQAFGTGRSLGASFRYYSDLFWGEAGVFAQAIGTEEPRGDKGWSVATRLLLRHFERQDLGFHIGGSFNFQRPDANGIQEGGDKYNRVEELGAYLGSPVDKIDMLHAEIPNAWGVYRYGGEFIGVLNNVYLQAEYIGMSVNRRKNWDYLFEQQLGDFWSYQDLESMIAWYGAARALHFNGCYAQFGWMILGDNYKYDDVNAYMKLPGKGSLELVLRYDFTSLNDVDGHWFDGDFYTNPANGQPNNSIGGGLVNSYTLGVNYSITKNLIVKLNYNYANLNSYRLYDNNLNTLAARIQYQF